MNTQKEVRDWMFRGLMFEAEAMRFRAAGIRLGADDTEIERSMLEETLSPFGVDLRNNALQMSRLYALVYCFENSVRDLIKGRLEEKYSAVQKHAESRQKDAEANSWLDAPSRELLTFTEFGHLADIIISQPPSNPLSFPNPIRCNT